MRSDNLSSVSRYLLGNSLGTCASCGESTSLSYVFLQNMATVKPTEKHCYKTSVRTLCLRTICIRNSNCHSMRLTAALFSLHKLQYLANTSGRNCPHSNIFNAQLCIQANGANPFSVVQPNARSSNRIEMKTKKLNVTGKLPLEHIKHKMFIFNKILVNALDTCQYRG